MEDLIHMHLELSSKNTRKKQVEESETRKCVPITVPVTRNHFRLQINQKWIQHSVI